jgi:tetratricopeptide (TPR) repeat protein
MGKLIIILTGVMVMVFPWSVWAASGAGEVRAGNRAYARGQYDRALDMYTAAARKSRGDARIDYDRGTAAYKLAKYRDAAGCFNKALLSEDPRLVRDAHYNLGNAYYKLGIEQENSDIAGAQKALEQSLAQYDASAAGDRVNDDAVANRRFVASELERLRKKQQEQKQKSGSRQGSSGSKDKEEAQDSAQPEAGNNSDGKKGAASGDAKKDPGAEASRDTAGKDRDGSKEPQSAEASKEQGSSAGQGEQGTVLSQDEVNVLLDDFAQNEQPRGLLKFNREPGRERPVSKDY